MFLSGRQPAWQPLRKWGVAVAVAASTLAWVGHSTGKGTVVLPLDPVALSTLPREAQATHRLIEAGGPFPYAKDGTTFGNRERLLPAERRGYYREYTVRTPGVKHRGARRIVCGGRQPVVPDACYYTDDHYASFRRIVSERR